MQAGKFKAECLKIMDVVKSTGKELIITKRNESADYNAFMFSYCFHAHPDDFYVQIISASAMSGNETVSLADFEHLAIDLNVRACKAYLIHL